MHISSKEKPRLPLRLLVLGMTLAVLHAPARSWAANGAAEPVPQAQHPCPDGVPPAMPDAFPGFSPESTVKCPPMASAGSHEGTRFESRLFALPLPADLTPKQQQIALAIMREAEPHLTVLHLQLRQTLTELHNLSFASDTPPDALAVIGRRLIRLRAEAMRELQRLSVRMEKMAGFNPGWGSRVRARAMPDVNAQPLRSPEDD